MSRAQRHRRNTRVSVIVGIPVYEHDRIAGYSRKYTGHGGPRPGPAETLYL